MGTRLIVRALPLGLVALAACGPYHRPLVPVMQNGDIVRSEAPQVVERARVEGETERGRLTEERLAATSVALATCAPAVCEAIARGEVALGMTQDQVLAATRTTAEAWEVRAAGAATLMTPHMGEQGPRDAMGRLAFVSVRNGAVASYTYREPQGLRTVSSPADATLAGRAAAQADALLRQGDEYAAAGDLSLALARYDQADVLRPGHPETSYRIASTLDKQLRPIEALIRYQLFLHQLEIERIDAHGRAAGYLADAIARARERVTVLERR
jgi:hypothetical protein